MNLEALAFEVVREKAGDAGFVAVRVSRTIHAWDAN
jgi:hypothetical protein